MYVFVVAVLLAASVPFGVASAQPRAARDEPVRVAPRRQTFPTGAEGVLAWSASRRSDRDTDDAYVKRDGADTIKVNAPGTSGYAGGIDGGTLTYQEISGRSSDLALFDIRTGGRSRAPHGVNTVRWEYAPTLSGEWLLFGRDTHDLRDQRIVLHHVPTGRQRVLDSGGGGEDFELFPGQVNGDFAVWSRCPNERSCAVHLHRMSTGESVRLLGPASRLQYAPAVAPDGTVYAFRSAVGCGRNVELVRFEPGALTATTVLRLPRGDDVYGTYVWVRRDGAHVVLHDRGGCDEDADFDLYRVVVAPRSAAGGS
jgi:hypothetical protein